MICSVLIACQNQHNLNVLFPESEVVAAYEKITKEILAAKKKGQFYVYEDASWPFICNPEHVQSISIRRQNDGQENHPGQEGNGQEAQ